MKKTSTISNTNSKEIFELTKKNMSIIVSEYKYRNYKSNTLYNNIDIIVRIPLPSYLEELKLPLKSSFFFEDAIIENISLKDDIVTELKFRRKNETIYLTYKIGESNKYCNEHNYEVEYRNDKSEITKRKILKFGSNNIEYNYTEQNTNFKDISFMTKDKDKNAKLYSVKVFNNNNNSYMYTVSKSTADYPDEVIRVINVKKSYLESQNSKTVITEENEIKNMYVSKTEEDGDNIITKTTEYFCNNPDIKYIDIPDCLVKETISTKTKAGIDIHKNIKYINRIKDEEKNVITNDIYFFENGKVSKVVTTDSEQQKISETKKDENGLSMIVMETIQKETGEVNNKQRFFTNEIELDDFCFYNLLCENAKFLL